MKLVLTLLNEGSAFAPENAGPIDPLDRLRNAVKGPVVLHCFPARLELEIVNYQEPPGERDGYRLSSATIVESYISPSRRMTDHRRSRPGRVSRKKPLRN